MSLKYSDLIVTGGSGGGEIITAGNGLTKTDTTLSVGDSTVDGDIILDNPSNSNQILIGSNNSFDYIANYANIIESYVPSSQLYGIYAGNEAFFETDGGNMDLFCIDSGVNLSNSNAQLYVSPPVNVGQSGDRQFVILSDTTATMKSENVTRSLFSTTINNTSSVDVSDNDAQMRVETSGGLNFSQLDMQFNQVDLRQQDQEGRIANLNFNNANFQLTSTSSLLQTSRIVVVDSVGTRGLDFRDGDVKIFSGDIDSKRFEFKMTQNGGVYAGSGLLNPVGIVYEADYSANYTNRSLVDKEYVDNQITGATATTEQEHISGTTLNINNGVNMVYVDPAASISGLTITMPSAPANGDEVKISFGGTIASGLVAEALTVQGNGGDTILRGDLITEADAGDGYVLKYQSSKNLWRIF